MGCDIHLYAEIKKNGKWENAQKVENCYEDCVPNIPYEKRIYTGRNYSLFSILANVRNGYGFAGCDTGNPLIPIAEPRGLPKDVSTEIKAISDEWDCDGHSHSWFILKEIMEYDWTQVATKRGWVNGINYYEWTGWREKEGYFPEEYCGNVSGKNIEHIDRKSMDIRIKNLIVNLSNNSSKHDIIKQKLNDVYTLIEWYVPYYRCCKEFLSETMPKLWRLGNPKEVRIVFWFDN